MPEVATIFLAEGIPMILVDRFQPHTRADGSAILDEEGCATWRSQALASGRVRDDDFSNPTIGVVRIVTSSTERPRVEPGPILIKGGRITAWQKGAESGITITASTVTPVDACVVQRGTTMTESTEADTCTLNPRRTMTPYAIVPCEWLNEATPERQHHMAAVRQGLADLAAGKPAVFPGGYDHNGHPLVEISFAHNFDIAPTGTDVASIDDKDAEPDESNDGAGSRPIAEISHRLSKVEFHIANPDMGVRDFEEACERWIDQDLVVGGRRLGTVFGLALAADSSELRLTIGLTADCAAVVPFMLPIEATDE